jgi:hypothetical protein
MNLAATMSLQAGSFLGPLQNVQGKLAGTIGSLAGLAKMVTGLGAAFGAFKSAEAIAENFFAVFEKGHALEKMHRITGESVQDLVVLQKAFSNAGVDSGDLQRQIVMLQKALGGVNEQGEPTKAIFAQLGLSIAQLQKLNAPAQFEALGAKLRDLPSAAQRTATAMAIFGRSGAEMLAVLDDPAAIKEAMKSASELGAIYQRNAKIFSQITILMASIKGKVSTLFAGIAEGAAPAFKAILEWVKKIDLVTVGQNIGQLLRAIPEAIEQGQIGELLNLTLQVGFAKATNLFIASMTAAIAGFGKLLIFAVSNLGSIADVLIGAAVQFGAALLNAFASPLTYFQAKMTQVGEQMVEFFNPTLKARSFATIFAERMKEGLSIGGMTTGEIGAAGRDQTARGMKGLQKPLVDLARQMAEMMKSFNVDDVAGAGPLAAALKALIDKLAPILTGGEGAKGGGGGPGLMATPKLESDRLAKIGLFIGGPGGPALDYARRTARATEIMAGVLSRNRAIDEGLQNRQSLWL